MSICKTLEPTSVQIFNYNLLQRGELHAHLQIHVVRNKLMQAPCAAPTPGSMGERLEAGERESIASECAGAKFAAFLEKTEACRGTYRSTV
jgi:hypothetical protein